MRMNEKCVNEENKNMSVAGSEADIRQQAYNAAHELCGCAGLAAGQIMVIGCSTSEVVGSRIGTNSDVDVALELFLGIKKALI